MNQTAKFICGFVLCMVVMWIVQLLCEVLGKTRVITLAAGVWFWGRWKEVTQD